jgi:hypothetical protein
MRYYPLGRKQSLLLLHLVFNQYLVRQLYATHFVQQPDFTDNRLPIRPKVKLSRRFTGARNNYCKNLEHSDDQVILLAWLVDPFVVMEWADKGGIQL